MTPGAAAGIRTSINKAYSEVEDPNRFKPAEFRAELAGALAAIRRLQ